MVRLDWADLGRPAASGLRTQAKDERETGRRTRGKDEREARRRSRRNEETEGREGKTRRKDKREARRLPSHPSCSTSPERTDKVGASDRSLARAARAPTPIARVRTPAAGGAGGEHARDQRHPGARTHTYTRGCVCVCGSARCSAPPGVSAPRPHKSHPAPPRPNPTHPLVHALPTSRPRTRARDCK